MATSKFPPLQPSPLIASPPIKPLSDLNPVTCVPPEYNLQNLSQPIDVGEKGEEEIPIIDLAILENGTPEQRAQVANDINTALEDWGFLMVVNHGVPEKVTEAMIEMARRFFNMTEEEKSEYAGKDVLDPIRYGTSFNPAVEVVRYWRDFLKLLLQPDNIVCPTRPHGFREAVIEYETSIKEVARALTRSLSSGLDKCFMEKAMELDTGIKYFAANFYPPCPQPELAMGLPPHTDLGYLTVLLQDNVGGLQVKHHGKWVDVPPHPGSLLINLGDNMEIFSNGKYKSAVHRVKLNNKGTRISIALIHAPSYDTVVEPAPEFVGRGKPNYAAVSFRDYLKYQQSNPLKERSVLELLKLP